MKCKNFLKIRFYLSWWAYSFPTAAISIATLLVYHLTKNVLFKYFAIVQLSVLTILIVILISKTVLEMAKKKICVYEED